MRIPIILTKRIWRESLSPINYLASLSYDVYELLSLRGWWTIQPGRTIQIDRVVPNQIVINLIWSGLIYLETTLTKQNQNAYVHFIIFWHICVHIVLLVVSLHTIMFHFTFKSTFNIIRLYFVSLLQCLICWDVKILIRN